MTSAAREYVFTEEELAKAAAPSGGGGYGAITVPGDYEAVLLSVEDYDKTEEGKTKGRIYSYGVDGGGGEVPFNIYVSDGTNMQWKRLEIFAAHGIVPTAGVPFTFDAAAFIGDMVGVHIDYPRDDEGDPTSTYREVRSIFALEAAPVEATETSVPTL